MATNAELIQSMSVDDLNKEEIIDNEAKKEYLKGYEKAVRQMERGELKIMEMRLNRMFPSQNSDGMQHAHNGTDMAEYAAILDKEERQCIEYKCKRIKLCREITDRIERLTSEDEKDILLYRYIKLMKWEDICVKMHVSWRQVHRLHTSALKNFKL